MEPRKPYPTDLTDHEWALIEPYVPTAKRGGRPEQYPKREILNGIFHIPSDLVVDSWAHMLRAAQPVMSR